MSGFGEGQQLVSWFAYSAVAMTSGMVFVNADPNLYTEFAPEKWGAPWFVLWPLWAAVHILSATAAWRVQIDAGGNFDWGLWIYVAYLISTLLWPVFFFPAVSRRLRAMMWVSVALSAAGFALIIIATIRFWHFSAMAGAFLLATVVFTAYTFPLSVVTVMKANYMRVAGEPLARPGVPSGQGYRRQQKQAPCDAWRTQAGDRFFGVYDKPNPEYCGPRTGRM